MSNYRFIVFSDAVDGKDAEFNRWYDEQHLPDVLAIPGFVAAQRFKASSARGEPPHRYLTLYEIETDDIAAVFSDLESRARTDRMPIPDVLTNVTSYVYEAAGDRVEANPDSFHPVVVPPSACRIAPWIAPA